MAIMPPPRAVPSGAPSPGNTGPAAVPGKNEGMKAKGSMLESVAVQVLIRAIEAYGPTSEEGADLLGTVAKMAKRVSTVKREISEQEVKLLSAKVPASIQPQPEQANQMARQAAQHQAQRLGLGGNAGSSATPPAVS